MYLTSNNNFKKSYVIDYHILKKKNVMLHVFLNWKPKVHYVVSMHNEESWLNHLLILHNFLFKNIFELSGSTKTPIPEAPKRVFLFA